jgi:hypothetical protein
MNDIPVPFTLFPRDATAREIVDGLKALRDKHQPTQLKGEELMSRNYLAQCHCGSGEAAFAEYDARGIFLCYCCDKCREDKLAGYRPEVLTDPDYECDEQIDPD